MLLFPPESAIPSVAFLLGEFWCSSSILQRIIDNTPNCLRWKSFSLPLRAPCGIANALLKAGLQGALTGDWEELGRQVD